MQTDLGMALVASSDGTVKAVATASPLSLAQTWCEQPFYRIVVSIKVPGCPIRLALFTWHFSLGTIQLALFTWHPHPLFYILGGRTLKTPKLATSARTVLPLQVHGRLWSPDQRAERQVPRHSPLHQLHDRGGGHAAQCVQEAKRQEHVVAR